MCICLMLITWITIHITCTAGVYKGLLPWGRDLATVTGSEVHKEVHPDKGWDGTGGIEHSLGAKLSCVEMYHIILQRCASLAVAPG